ncbi:hypothetical protein HDU91_005873, partial [Kappamyces sp. JEL0680]
MVLLFMSERAIFSLVGQTSFVFNQTHRFAPGPLYGSALNLDDSVDVYAFVRFNNGRIAATDALGFTPAELIAHHMNNWAVMEDPQRHKKWHGKTATWFDVLTNKISVDRSSVGNALYLVLNLASKGASPAGKNYANIEEWSQSRPTTESTINHSLQNLQPSSMQMPQHSPQQIPQPSSFASQGYAQDPTDTRFDANLAFQMQLQAQEQLQAQLFQQQQQQMQQQMAMGGNSYNWQGQNVYQGGVPQMGHNMQMNAMPQGQMGYGMQGY